MHVDIYIYIYRPDNRRHTQLLLITIRERPTHFTASSSSLVSTLTHSEHVYAVILYNASSPVQRTLQEEDNLSLDRSTIPHYY